MKKFVFPLQKVLEYNEHIQKREQDILAAMRAEYYKLEKMYLQLVEKYEYHKIKYLEDCEAGINISNVSFLLQYINEVEKQIKQLYRKMAEKQAQIDKQTEKLVQVSKDKVTVEKLKDSKFEKHKAAEHKSSEKFIEEFISYINSTAI